MIPHEAPASHAIGAVAAGGKPEQGFTCDLLDWRKPVVRSRTVSTPGAVSNEQGTKSLVTPCGSKDDRLQRPPMHR